jgi:hypothetical protein
LDNRALRYPRGYRIAGDGHARTLYRVDGTKVWRFDPAAVLDCEVNLAAFEDHWEQLVQSAGYQAEVAQTAPV